MKRSRQNHGRISDHFKGSGTVTRDTVVERAREIALINGRRPNEYTQEDFARAKSELTGAALENVEDDAVDDVAGLVTWDEAPTATGHPGEKEELDDEQSFAEQLVEEGMEEAEHEQMVAGAKIRRDQE